MKEEQHLHNTTKDKWGGNIARAVIGGAITGLTSSIGLKGGEYLGNLAGASVQSTLGTTMANSINTAVNASVTSYTSSVGNVMSNVAINGGSFSDIMKSGTKAMTDKNTLKNTAISGLTAGLTAGLTGSLNLNNPTTFTERLAQNTLSNVTSSAVQSVINGDSFTDSIKGQIINTLVTTGASYGANWIGEQYHTNGFSENDFLNKTIQLTLHAGLGAIEGELMGGDGMVGAVSGVAGELTGDLLNNNEVNKKVGIEMSGLSSAVVSLFIGKLRGLDSNEISNNIYTGYRIGKNASENNAYIADRPLEGIFSDLYGRNEVLNYLNQEILHEQIFFEDEEGGNIGFFDDGKVRADNEENINNYKNKDGVYYRDDIMREAVNNVEIKKYKLFDFSRITGVGSDDQYNCQDFMDDVRREYYKMLTNRIGEGK